MRKIFIRKLLLIVVLLAVVSAIIALVYFSAHATCCTEELSESQILQISNEADKGNVVAMKRLFFFFEERQMKGDSEKAEYWLKRAADAGDGEAEVFMYQRLIVSHDVETRKRALNYVKNAADHGNSTAQEILGDLHLQ